ncbi:SDR family oxidoreductase [Alicyclobacillus tolerans]|uniref:SDR family NAD(P)-dependent oxidoreductase n=1 Tax=Alicyclobacillus tolerans TaxID=90970 RepID=UPI001F35C618|nr:SDR family oxidoreductase [Alicyclobacillus tolerans]MCF8567300.1 SDR family oxidoreductase [Alicyclobacillus tolerans]
MEGKVVLVTGGGRGIGAATSKLLASRGAKVVVNFAQNGDAANHVVKDITGSGGQAIALQADVRNDVQVSNMVSSILDIWGTVDALVNNANMSFAMKPIAEMTWDEFAQKLNDEMKAAFLMTKAVTPIMAAKHYGRIVYVASGLARRPTRRMSAHGSAKAALVQFARYVAEEYGSQGITANIISPGLVMTEATRFQPEENLKRIASLTPLGHVATPEDVAQAIAMYCSDGCQFVTGTYVPVNGGMSMD